MGIQINGQNDTITAIDGSITVGTDLTVPGVLSYEDVTNVDSIGLVTARSGIHVTGGSVGIGTDNPGDLLTLYGTDPTIKLQDSSGDAFSLIEADNTDEGSLRFRADPLNAGANTHIRFDTDGSERLRIDSSGNIGINSTSPKTNLDISQQTGAVALPQGTTAQRPSRNAPYIRYNTTNSALEFYNGTDWVEIISDYFPSGSTILG